MYLAGQQELSLPEVESAEGRLSQAQAGPEAGALGGPAGWLWPATREHGSAVLLREASAEELQDLEIRAIARKCPDPLPRNLANQALLDSWVSLLSPHFGDDSVNLTGTYSDDYGYSHGLMLARNVMADFARAIEHERPGVFLPRCIGVEPHRTGRVVLHFHAMVGGEWSEDDRGALKEYWDWSRGWSVAKAVSDAGGCVGYVAKHLLKRGAADNFDFRVVPPARAGSRQRRREDAR